MAAAGFQQLRDVVKLEPNVPVEMALNYPTGKIVNGINGQRVMFSLVGDRVMFLDLGQAQRINELKVKPREPFSVCLKWSGKRGDPKEFTAWLTPEAEKRRAAEELREVGDEFTARRMDQSADRARAARVGQQPDGTFVVPGGAAPAPKPEKRPGRGEEIAGMAVQGRASQLVDAYAATLTYARRHGDQVKPEDVRWFVIAAFLGERHA